MNRPYQYLTCCVNSTGPKIHAMVDAAREVTLRTLRRHVSTEELKGVFGFYTWGVGPGLHLKNDWAVSYHKSTYDGQPCYYVDHSSIEYIFTQEVAQ